MKKMRDHCYLIVDKSIIKELEFELKKLKKKQKQEFKRKHREW